MNETSVVLKRGGVTIQSVSELQWFADAVVSSGLAPSSFKRPEQVIIAVQMGMELGLSPMASLRAFAVINGKPTLYGDVLPALAWASGKLLRFEETIEGTGEETAAICLTQRVGQPEPRITRFSVAMAKRAKLWGKSGPWSDYPQRMLQMRARSWNFRDNLADVLAGMAVAEEAADYAPAVMTGQRAIAEPEAAEGIHAALQDAEEPGIADAMADADRDPDAPSTFDLLVEAVEQYWQCSSVLAHAGLVNYCAAEGIDIDHLSQTDAARLREAIAAGEVTV